MNNFHRQFRILLWKNYLLKKRHYYMTFFEIFLPLITSAMMVITISQSDPNISLKPKYRGLQSSNYSTLNQNQKFKAVFFDDPVYNLSEVLGAYVHFKTQINYLIAPDNKCVKRFMRKYHEGLRRFFRDDLLIEYIMLKSVDEVEDTYNDITGGKVRVQKITIAIIFHNQCDIEYRKFLKNFVGTIRTLGPNDGSDFKRHFPEKISLGPLNHSYYLKENQQGFLETLNFINLAYLASITEDRKVKKNISISNIVAYKYPFLNYMEKPPVTLVDIVPSVVVYSFIFFFPLIVKQIVQENQNRSRDMYKLMGLNDFVYYGTIFLIYFGELFIQVSLLTFLYTFKFGKDSPALFHHSNPFLIFLILLIFGMNLILVAILFSIFFTNPNIAIIASIVFYLLLDIAQYFIDPKYNKTVSIDSKVVKTIQVISCLLPTLSVKFSMRVLIFSELYNVGASFSYIFQTTYLYGYLSIGLIIFMNFCSILLNLLLIYYMKNVWPFQYGLVKPWYFPFISLLKLWSKQVESVKRKLSQTSSKSLTKETGSTKSEFSIDAKYFEEDVSKTQIKVSLQDLVKKYGKKTVLSNINLNLHENQLTALLGNNGAGKTTLLNLIIGFSCPTSGKVLINGFDLKKNPDKARTSLSLCPQHNVLYDELTAYEHLMIYGTIKGKSTEQELEWEINDLLEKFQLKSKKNIQSAGYSGGMKRKLNLAIALIGQSKIVILDEPTAGIDSESRRIVWDVLLKEKRSRTILLTTHFIEESDVLGDKILIMCKGKVHCYGSPIFLKNIFGMGYQLRIAKDQKFNITQGAHEKLKKFIREFFKNSIILDENVGEIVYSLDRGLKSFKEEISTNVFTRFFTKFENIRKSLHISTFGITLITLEDVFLKIVYLSNEKDEESDKKLSLERILKDEKVCSFLEDVSNENKIQSHYALFLQRFKALIIKRLHHSKRHYPTLIFQFIIPLFIFSLILYLDVQLTPMLTDKEAFTLAKDIYGESNGIFKDNTGDENLFKSYNRSAHDSLMKITKLNWNQRPDHFIANKSGDQQVSNYINFELYGGVVRKLPDSTEKLMNLELEIWFNNEAGHALPLAMCTMYRALFDYVDDLENEYREVRLINQPFLNPAKIMSSLYILNGLKVMWSLLSSVGLPFLAASYCLFPIQEYVSKSKLLQKMAGTTGYLYWITTFTFDLICHLIFCLMILLVFFIQDKKSIFFTHSSSVFSLFLLFLLFGLSTIQVCYVLSRLFKSISTGFLTIVVVNLIFGVTVVIIEFFVDYLGATDKLTQETLSYIRSVFRIFPIYSVAKGVSNLYTIGSKAHICDIVEVQRFCETNLPLRGCCADCTTNCLTYKNPLVWNSDYSVLKEIVALLIVFQFCFVLNLAIEYNLLLKLIQLCIPKSRRMQIVIAKRPDSEILQNLIEDPDVIQEKKRVEFLIKNKKQNDVSMLIYHLSKAFYKFIAVDDLSFALNKKECFGLLGVNGAGKTTTFEMLVGELEATEGTAFIKNLNLKNDLSMFQQKIGYCPQFDALLDNLTGEEILYLFGRLRGIKEDKLKQTVDYIIKMIDLKRHSKSFCVNLSGGNKRKLSLGIALIGLPKILFLDEPTAGVDPEAKRKLWATLVFIKEKFNCSIVLTSHSMDECEALCSRVAIMVAGKFKCLNSVQNLRQKYGRGYTLTMKLKPECLDHSLYLTKLREKIKHVFPSATCKDFHETLLNYQIEDNVLKWSFLFEKMDELRNEFDLEYYLLSDTTLESIFINFAKSNNTDLIHL